jgi:hypothetical protein
VSCDGEDVARKGGTDLNLIDFGRFARERGASGRAVLSDLLVAEASVSAALPGAGGRVGSVEVSKRGPARRSAVMSGPGESSGGVANLIRSSEDTSSIPARPIGRGRSGELVKVRRCGAGSFEGQ